MSPRGLLEAGAFLAVALGLHLAAFGALPGAGGASSAGAGGEDLVSLSAASPEILAALADYERPPEVAPAPEPPPEPAPEPAPAPLAEPAPEPPAEAPPAPRIAAPQIAAPAQPEAAPNLPPEAVPEPAPAPVPKIRPAPRPEKPREPAKPKPAKAPKPAKPAPAPSAPSVAQKAAGAGGGANAGVNGAAEAATLSKAREQDLRARWGATIRARIEARKRYPSAAGRAQGRVTVALSVARTGALGGVSLARSSGNAALDQAALEAVRRAGRFPAAPAGLTRASYDFTLTIQFAR